MKLWICSCLVIGVATASMAGERTDARPSRPERFMAVTVDDLPVAQTSWHTDEQMARITTELLATFAEHGVPAVGFVTDGIDRSVFQGEPEPPEWVAAIRP